MDAHEGRFEVITARAAHGLLLGVLAAFVAFAARAITGFGGEVVADVFNDVVYNAIILGAALALALRAVGRPQDRAAWLIIAAGLACWAGGEVYWTLALSDRAEPPFPSWSDALYLTFYPCCYVGLGLLVRARLRGLSTSVWLDGLTGGLGAAALAAALLLGRIAETTGGEPAAVATNLAYPIGDLVLLAGAVLVLGVTGWRPGRLWALVAASFIINAVADTTYLYQAAGGTYVEGAWLDVLWPAGAVLLAAAAWFDTGRGEAPRIAGWRLLLIPVVAVIAAVALLFYDHGATEVNTAARLLALATLAAALLRVGLAFRESVLHAQHSTTLALTDELTGLGNRRRLLGDLAHALAAGTPDDPRLLVLLDLNGFKQYNDSFGHPAGDGLLARLAHKLDAAVAGHGRAYRMGGDEFCALLRPGDTPVAELVATVAEALSDEGPGFAITAASGSALLPAEATQIASALQLADRRLYAEKDGRPSSVKRQLRSVLLQAIREREPDLHRHVEGVGRLAAAIGRHLGMDAENLDVLTRAAELHDVGKMAVPDAILEKPGPLDADEREFMRRHTVLGERILLAAPAMAPVARLVRSSHERWDGGGYPDGLVAGEIPLGARIIFVCDAYEAITSDRPYRSGASHEHAIAELRGGAGTQFDPDVVDAFCAIADEALAAAPADIDGRVAAQLGGTRS